MAPFNYSELQLGPNTTRLVRLLPSERDDTPIRCELITYKLPESTGKRHLYEALSYVWGSQSETHTIIVNGCEFQVTRNLYTALVHLRDNQLERILWIDAICINQGDDDEKSEQIPLMRSIYAQADRVIVWLGEAMRDGDEALKTIQRWAAASIPCDDSLLDPCSRLLQRDWFQRTWVLQEVGVARCISILCGSVEINGHVFCEGLEHSLLSLPSFTYPVLHLIRGSFLRPRYEIDPRGTLAIGELIDMYRFHKATMLYDKVYSLLGLCVEDPEEVGLKPNYRLPWNEVFMQAIMHVFPSSCSVETWPGSPVAVIKGKGLVLGYVGFVDKVLLKYGSQNFEVKYNNTARALGYETKWGTKWNLNASAESVREGNIIFLLKGASSPIIVRLCRGYFTVIVSTTVLQSYDNMERSNEVSTQMGFPAQGSLHDIVLVWDISSADGEENKEHDDPKDLINVVPHYQETASEKEKRLRDIALISEGIMMQILQQTELTFYDWFLYSAGLRRKGSLAGFEDIIKIAVEFEGNYEIRIVEQLLEHCRDSLPVSENVVAAAAASEGFLGFGIMGQLLKHCGKSLPVTDAVVKTAAANEGFFGHRIFKQLLEHCGESLPVSEDVIKAAEANEDDGQELLLAYGKPEPTRI